MVIPFIPALVGHAARFAITGTSLKASAGTFAQALPFGAGYSFGTYLGFPKNYQSRSSGFQKSSNMSFSLDNQMPYGSGYGRPRYSRYGRSRYSRYQPFRRRRYYRPSYRRY